MDAVKEVVDKVKDVTIGDSSAGPSAPAPAPAPAAKPKGEKKEKQKKPAAPAAPAAPLELDPPPVYIDHRIQLFEKLKAEYDAECASKPREPITITILPEGRTMVGESWVTSPLKIAIESGKGVADKTVISKVDGVLWDLPRPLEKDCSVELLDFDNIEAKKVFWHSSAHVLGEAAERHFGCHLCLGPPTDDGFFYEMGMAEDGQAVKSEDVKPLETIAGKIIKEKQPFERLVVSKENLLEMFKHNKFKQVLISSKIPDGTSSTVYRCGPLIDLCVGPHIPNTGRIKAFSVMKHSSCYFLGDSANETLQRIYGVSFPDKKLMDEHKKYLEEAAKRDHRKIGKEQELFFFDPISPGSAFFLPHGTRIYNTLMAFLREEYWKRGYDEVITPNMYNSSLWKTSGHWENYKDDMFTLDVDKEQFGLKPMNCPGHCVVFGHRERSYRELPWRMADFGVLHRNEASGALTGLTRVRRFQQDDTHIFCTKDQVKDEIMGLFDFLKHIYGKLGFTFKLNLSTRPDKYLGEIETWNKAEDQLKEALDLFATQGGGAWELNPGDGAFYGPKIDITISDALRREFQCATIQLDFQLPQRFKLRYNTGAPSTKDENGEDIGVYDTPVMVHRAIYGSFERFTAILTEHFAGKWPFWLSPRQILILPVTPQNNDYVIELQKIFHDAGFYVDIDISGNTMKKKILQAQMHQYNFTFVVGADECKNRSVNARDRDNQESQNRGALLPVDDVIKRLTELKQSRELDQTHALRA
ncbi:threonyl-tRNA synthetase [Orbilia oligospora]|uniref:Probable threonine--tRNA ligase, cytoplasmic n=1 Tax=Orbilia oligospora TaxID=2813651 RepID=A0A7C8N3S1_ORBOL|nr:threonyl-tRNA synthetase [Orbilia oligospora]KAF3109629.1 threonyl-tRNA synthetase [Orbilia oligospora]KAF3114971.1 threonyl-tRNA synthetase [Orbilia oligospora]KAF3120708.1 threonyl-tRNA synthetase [Orbilia oligospora]KAF3121967.1 threonyl-tRNA synthetase [Orbilia oligospora]